MCDAKAAEAEEAPKPEGFDDMKTRLEAMDEEGRQRLIREVFGDGSEKVEVDTDGFPTPESDPVAQTSFLDSDEPSERVTKLVDAFMQLSVQEADLFKKELLVSAAATRAG